MIKFTSRAGPYRTVRASQLRAKYHPDWIKWWLVSFGKKKVDCIDVEGGYS